MFSYKKYIPLLAVALLCVVFGSCRKSKVTPIQEKYFIKYFGGSNQQEGNKVILASDGGYVVVGTTNSFGNGGNDIYVVKTDKAGNEQWNVYFGGSGDDEGKSIVQASDGGYVILGSKTMGDGNTNMFAIKINEEGIQQWSYDYGFNGEDETGESLQKTTDGGYILVGSTTQVELPGMANTRDIYLVRIDVSGDMIWERAYGISFPDQGTAVQQLNDTMFATSGISTLTADRDMIIATPRVQYNSGTYTILSTTYITKDNPVNEDFIYGAKDIYYDKPNDRLKILGTARNTTTGNIDIFFLSINRSSGVPDAGSFQIYGGSGIETPGGFYKCSDGGFIITGSTTSEGEGGKDIYLLRINANGIGIWSKTFGGEADDEGSSVVQTADGGYAICGTVTFGGNGIGANRVMSLIKTDENGELKGK